MSECTLQEEINKRLTKEQENEVNLFLLRNDVKLSQVDVSNDFLRKYVYEVMMKAEEKKIKEDKENMKIEVKENVQKPQKSNKAEKKEKKLEKKKQEQQPEVKKEVKKRQFNPEDVENPFDSIEEMESNVYKDDISDDDMDLN